VSKLTKLIEELGLCPSPVEELFGGLLGTVTKPKTGRTINCLSNPNEQKPPKIVTWMRKIKICRLRNYGMAGLWTKKSTNSIPIFYGRAVRHMACRWEMM